jgi:hypothetical protein
MPAYIKKVHEYVCKNCRIKPAKYEVYNAYNAYMGHFCKKCAEVIKKRLNEND